MRHTLRGKNLLPEIKKPRGMDQPKAQLARYRINTPLKEREEGKKVTDGNLKFLLHLQSFKPTSLAI